MNHTLNLRLLITARETDGQFSGQGSKRADPAAQRRSGDAPGHFRVAEHERMAQFSSPSQVSQESFQQKTGSCHGE